MKQIIIIIATVFLFTGLGLCEVVEYGQVIEGKLTNLKIYKEVPGGEHKLLKAGYKRVYTIKADFDKDTQRLLAPVVVDLEDRIERQYAAENIPEATLNK